MVTSLAKKVYTYHNRIPHQKIFFWGDTVAVTKVAAFFQTSPSSLDTDFQHTPEADFAAALLFLREKIKGPLRISYFSRLYLPFFLVHALPGRSLIISGIGEPKITIRHASVPPLAQLRDLLRSSEELEMVPYLLDQLQEKFKEPPSEFISIRNAMLPTMIDTLRQLVNPQITEPSEETCIDSRLSTKDIHDVGILFRTERSRLENGLTQLGQAEDLLEEFIEEQLRLLETRRANISAASSLRWEAPTTPQPRVQPEDSDAPMAQLEAEKQHISQELMRFLGRLEETLSFSSDQIRRLINQIQANLSQTEKHIKEVKTRLTQLQNTSNEFESIIQQTLVDVESSAKQLEEVEQRWLWSRSQTPPSFPSPVQPPFPTGTVSFSSPLQPTEKDQMSSEDIANLRTNIVRAHSTIQEAMKALRATIEQQYSRFETIGAPADTLQGYLPLMRLLVPVFVVKVGEVDDRYGIISPLLLRTPFSSNKNIEFYDEVFSDQLQQLMRTEIRTNNAFQLALDEKARINNWITKAFSMDKLQQGAHYLAELGVVSNYDIEHLTSFWEAIIKPK
jgi:hypothetical protein